MVLRVTNQAQQATALRNIFRITEDLFRANERIATGKRVNAPSDDPSAIRDSLALKTSIQRSKQFQRNITSNRVFLQSADSALETITVSLTRARELGLQALAGTDTAETRSFAAIELNNLLSQALQAANTKVKNQFLFSGTRLRTEPFLLTAGSGVVYQGNTERYQVEIAENQLVPLTLPGSEMLAADMNPALSLNTQLSDLNAGAGVPAGTFSITDRAGNTANITVTAGQTINDVINSINASGLNLTASLNSSRTGLLLTDTSTVITGALTVSDPAGSTTAQALGLAARVDGNIQGKDLDPRLTASTLITDLNGGQGLSLGSVNVVNGAASATISLSTAVTVGDILNTFNTAGLNVNARINSRGNALELDSTTATTTAVVREVGGGTTAEVLGLGGAGNVFIAFTKLQQALSRDDNFGILASLDALETTIVNLSDARAELGSISRRLDLSEDIHENDVVIQTEQLSEAEDTDLVREASNVAQLEFALEATLNTTARILQPSLLDFLR